MSMTLQFRLKRESVSQDLSRLVLLVLLMVWIGIQESFTALRASSANQPSRWPYINEIWIQGVYLNLS